MSFNLSNIGPNSFFKLSSKQEAFISSLLQSNFSASKSSIKVVVLTYFVAFTLKYKINFFLYLCNKAFPLHLRNLTDFSAKICKIVCAQPFQKNVQISSLQLRQFSYLRTLSQRKKIFYNTPKRISNESFQSLKIEEILKKYQTKLKVKRVVRLCSFLYKGASMDEKRIEPYYHPEVLDPWHRYGSSLYPFFTLWKESTTKDRFLVWMNKIEQRQPVEDTETLLARGLINANREMVKMPTVRYLTDEQLQPHRVDIVGGKIYAGKYGFVDTTQSKYPFIFILTLDEEIFIGTKEKDKDIYTNHSSFSKGKPLILAGVLEARDGVITKVRDESGHYYPSIKMMFEGLKILEKKGIPLENVVLEFGGYNASDKYAVRKSYKQAPSFLNQPQDFSLPKFPVPS